jgi:hypothetical protein
VLERLAPAIHPFERVIIYDQNCPVILMPRGFADQLRRPSRVEGALDVTTDSGDRRLQAQLSA